MIVALIQARMNSYRLPGKSMALIEGVPLIEHVVNRVNAAQLVDKVCVCTTYNATDADLAAHVESMGVDVYRGSEDDVLSRLYWAAMGYPDAIAFVRITADDPFKDPELIDTLLTAFVSEWADREQDECHYMSLGGTPTKTKPTLGITWPMGLGVEVFTVDALERAYRGAYGEDREHVTTYMIEKYPTWDMKNPYGHGSINTRWTIDTEADLEFARGVYARLYADDPLFGYEAMREAGY